MVDERRQVFSPVRKPFHCVSRVEQDGIVGAAARREPA
jgi:hypothetical protein